MKILLPLLGVLLLLAANNPSEYDDSTILIDPIQGTWELMAVKHNGNKVEFKKYAHTY